MNITTLPRTVLALQYAALRRPLSLDAPTIVFERRRVETANAL